MPPRRFMTLHDSDSCACELRRTYNDCNGMRGAYAQPTTPRRTDIEPYRSPTTKPPTKILLNDEKLVYPTRTSTRHSEVNSVSNWIGEYQM